MKIAKVIGNVVSTIKDEKFNGHKLMIIEYIDLDGHAVSPRQIAFDCADSGPGDVVLVCEDGGATKMFFDDNDLIADWTICGVIDHFSVKGSKKQI